MGSLLGYTQPCRRFPGFLTELSRLFRSMRVWAAIPDPSSLIGGGDNFQLVLLLDPQLLRSVVVANGSAGTDSLVQERL
jgi:hypothetical protein